MSTNEYAEFILQEKKEAILPQAVDETAAYEATQLLSGSFTYLLYEALWMNNFDMDTIRSTLTICTIVKIISAWSLPILCEVIFIKRMYLLVFICYTSHNEKLGTR